MKRLREAVDALSCPPRGTNMHRPREILWFERIILATLCLGALNSWLAWPQLVAMAGPTFVITVQLLTFGLMLGLTLLISRRRSNIAKWISVAMFLLGLPFWVQQMLSGTAPGSMSITWTQFALQVCAYLLLFAPASRSWFNKKIAAG